LPRGLLAVIDKAMRKDVAQRYPSIRAFAAALAPFAGRAGEGARLEATSPTDPSPPTTGDAAPRRSRRGLVVGTALAMAGVAVGVVTMAIIDRREDAPARPAATVAGEPAPVSAPEPPPAPPVAASAPAALEAEKVSERSGQSERAGTVAAPARARRGRGRPEEAARPTLKLDPNPY
jgi:hypothetical protein